MFNIHPDINIAEYAMQRQSDNLTLNDARYLARLSEALGCGKREVLIAWDESVSAPKITVDEFTRRGGNPDQPIGMYLRADSGEPVLAASIARQFVGDMFAGFRALCGLDDQAAVQFAMANVLGVSDAVKNRVQEVIAAVRRR